MKIGIVGSRNYSDWARVWNYVFSLPAGTQIVSGGCPNSPDVWAISAAQQRQKLSSDLAKPIIFPVKQAPGETFGFAAYRRNVQIIECGIEKLVAFWDGTSKGTKNAIQIADRKAIPVEVISPIDGLTLTKKEECRIDVFNCIAASDGEEEAIYEELMLMGYGDVQIGFILAEFLKENKVVREDRSKEPFGGVYWLMTDPEKWGLPHTIAMPPQPVDMPATGAIGSPPCDSPKGQEMAVESDSEFSERLTDEEENALSDELNKVPPKHKAAMRAIEDFEKSVASAEGEEDNWDFGEYPFEEVKVTHYQPRNNKVIANVYNFREEGRCSCPRQGFINVPCKHTIAREKKLREYTGSHRLASESQANPKERVMTV